MHALQTCRGEVTFYGNTRRTATCTHYRRVEAKSRFTATPGEQPHVRTLDVSRRCHVLRQHQENSHMHALQTCRGKVTFYGNTRRTATCMHLRRIEAMSRFTATPGEQPHARTIDVSRRCHVLRQHQENSHMHAPQTCRGDVTFYGNTKRTATCTKLCRGDALVDQTRYTSDMGGN